MDGQVEKIKQFLDSLDGSVDDLQTKLQPIITKSLEEVVSNVESPIDKIEIYNSFSYVLISLIVAYLRSSGVDTNDHPIMKELDRIKLYMKRHKDLIDEQAGKEKKLDNTKEYLQNTLGQKSVTSNTVSDKINQPAISSDSFGKHTRFSN